MSSTRNDSFVGPVFVPESSSLVSYLINTDRTNLTSSQERFVPFNSVSFFSKSTNGGVGFTSSYLRDFFGGDKVIANDSMPGLIYHQFNSTETVWDNINKIFKTNLSNQNRTEVGNDSNLNFVRSYKASVANPYFLIGLEKGIIGFNDFDATLRYALSYQSGLLISSASIKKLEMNPADNKVSIYDTKFQTETISFNPDGNQDKIAIYSGASQKVFNMEDKGRAVFRDTDFFKQSIVISGGSSNNQSNVLEIFKDDGTTTQLSINKNAKTIFYSESFQRITINPTSSDSLISIFDNQSVKKINFFDKQLESGSGFAIYSNSYSNPILELSSVKIGGSYASGLVIKKLDSLNPEQVGMRFGFDGVFGLYTATAISSIATPVFQFAPASSVPFQIANPDNSYTNVAEFYLSGRTIWKSGSSNSIIEFRPDAATNSSTPIFTTRRTLGVNNKIFSIFRDGTIAITTGTAAVNVVTFNSSSTADRIRCYTDSGLTLMNVNKTGSTAWFSNSTKILEVNTNVSTSIQLFSGSSLVSTFGVHKDGIVIAKSHFVGYGAERILFNDVQTTAKGENQTQPSWPINNAWSHRCILTASGITQSNYNISTFEWMPRYGDKYINIYGNLAYQDNGIFNSKVTCSILFQSNFQSVLLKSISGSASIPYVDFSSSIDIDTSDSAKLNTIYSASIFLQVWISGSTSQHAAASCSRLYVTMHSFHSGVLDLFSTSSYSSSLITGSNWGIT